jgi:hypothetical protein
VAVDCDDGYTCTIDSCDEGNDICVNTNTDANCSNLDGDICTTPTCDPILPDADPVTGCDELFDASNDLICDCNNSPPGICDE